MSRFPSRGRLQYRGGFNLRVLVDPEIVRYYRRLLPPWVPTNPQLYAPHISVVRREAVPRAEAWGRHEGEEVEFVYSHTVRHGEVYVWLDAWSVRLEEVREELGLSNEERFTPPPAGFRKTFHITIGNWK